MPGKITTEDFISRASKIHNNKYDYSKVIYTKAIEKVIIICPDHGEFLQLPHQHLMGNGCPKCSGPNKDITLKEQNFLKTARIVHDNKYNYSKINYIKASVKINIICTLHGIFSQSPNNHLRGQGCPKCKSIRTSNRCRSSTDEFIVKANRLHRNSYDYSKVDYITSLIKVKIKCQFHGDFLQTPGHHLSGRGCPICKLSKGEIQVGNWCDDNNLQYIKQKEFKNLIGSGGGNLKFDFYLQKLNMCIEYDGEQHFNFSKGLHITKENFKKLQTHDKRKNEYCKKYNIKLLRIRYDEDVDVVLSNYFNL